MSSNDDLEINKNSWQKEDGSEATPFINKTLLNSIIKDISCTSRGLPLDVGLCLDNFERDIAATIAATKQERMAFLVNQLNTLIKVPCTFNHPLKEYIWSIQNAYNITPEEIKELHKIFFSIHD